MDPVRSLNFRSTLPRAIPRSVSSPSKAVLIRDWILDSEHAAPMVAATSLRATVGNRVLETGLLSQPASFQCELRNSGPSQPVSRDWKLEKNCLTRSSRREVGSIHDMSGGLAACGVASAVLYPPSGVPPHHGTVQCRFVASCGDRGSGWNIEHND